MFILREIRAPLILFVIFLTVLVDRGICRKWQMMHSVHFLVYYIEDNDNKGFARQTLREAEQYYRKISSSLGYGKYSKFWEEKRQIKIYLFPTKKEYLENTGQPFWSDGVANYRNRTISSFIDSKSFFDSLLPHELTHIVFRDFVGFKGKIPLWIDEGVAQWQEKGKKEYVRSKMKDLVKRGEVLPLSDLSRIDVRQVKDERTVEIFYMEAVSVVDFLIEKYGSIRFLDLCLKLRDGADFEASLEEIYPPSAASIDKLDRRWRKYVLEGY